MALIIKSQLVKPELKPKNSMKEIVTNLQALRQSLEKKQAMAKPTKVVEEKPSGYFDKNGKKIEKPSAYVLDILLDD
jgi:hypothetical protein